MPIYRPWIAPTGGGTLHTQTLTETLTLSDTLVKQPRKVLTESITLTDILLKRIQKVFSETLSLTDLLSAFKTKVITLLETITLTDVLVKMPGKVLSETITLTDSLNRSISFLLLETLNLVDSVNKKILKTAFLETITLSDVLTTIKNPIAAVARLLNLLGVGQ